MSTIFQLTRDQIINAAYRKLSVVAIDQTADAFQLATGTEALNAIVATFQALGMPLWARKELDITMVSGQRDYTIGVGKAINVPFPLHLYQANLTTPTNNSQIDLNVMARYDFNLLPTNSYTGIPVNVTYQPFINYGVLSVWPIPDASTPVGTTITITYQSPFEYFVAGTDVPDFPQEWANALIYHLALSLAPENGLPIMDQQNLEKQAGVHLSTALSNGTEDASIFFSPNYRGT